MIEKPALRPGKPRLGVAFFSSYDPARPAMAFDNGEELELTVSFDYGDPVGRRFTGRSMKYADDPDYELHDYSMPRQAWFADSHGVVCLVAPLGRSISMSSMQEGRLRFAYAVKADEVGVDFAHVHAVRSHIEGLAEWVPIGSVSHELMSDLDGHNASVITLGRQEPLRIPRRLNAQIRPTYSYRTSEIPGQSTIEDAVCVETSVAAPRAWEDHLDVHRAVRELLVVAGWQDYGTVKLQVSRRENAGEPLTFVDRWAQVTTYAVSASSQPPRQGRFLFDFGDIGLRGVRRWLRLRDRYRRGIAGMTHAVGMRGVALETAVSEVGASLEHLGYAIAVERGEPPGKWLEGHLRRVAAEEECELRFDLSTWPGRLADAYNTVKHPDRPDEWESLDLANVLRESRLIFRAWVARRLGVPRATLERNLGLVPMSRPYERW